jgi:CMP-N-acetylneuraminic acid synthetase
LRLLLDKPLIAYTVEVAVACPSIDRVVVSTDDREIAETARAYGAEVPFIRPSDLAQDLTTTEDTLRHAVLWLDREEGYHTDVVVFLTCTNPFRKAEWVAEAVDRLLADDNLDTVFVAMATHKNYWRKIDTQYRRLAPDLVYASRQVREPIYREDTGIACATRADLIREGQRVGANVDIVVTTDERTTIDIHNEYDLWLAERTLAEWPMDREVR